MAHPRENPDKKFTYADYLTWPDEEKWEILDGEAFDMTPSPGTEHQEILAGLVTQFHLYFRDRDCRVFPDIDVILPSRKEADEKVKTVFRPDLSVVCAPEKIDGKRIRGAPDLVVEILSPSTASYDCIKKRRAYEIAGVKELWLVQPSDRITMVFRLEGDGTFGKPLFFDRESKVSLPLFQGLEIDLSKVFPKPRREVRESPARYRRKKN